jgi:hypothetical protein
MHRQPRSARIRTTSAQLCACRCNATPLRGLFDDGDIRRSGRRDAPTFSRDIVKKLILLALAAAVAATPACTALTSNTVTTNALTSNALTSNALTSNALTSNSLSFNGASAKGGSMVVTGDAVRAVTLRSGERVTLH